MTVNTEVREWEIVKRDGRVESFRKSKVHDAIVRCYINGLGKTHAEALAKAEIITGRAINFLAGSGNTRPTVEDVQRAVIHQLWAEGEAVAAEAYTIYREEHRKIREKTAPSAEVIARINEDAQYFPTPLQAYQFYSKFSRWREEDSRRETWVECNDRVFSWFATLPSFQLLSQEEVSWLRRMMLGMKASPALRVVQMAGPALERCQLGVYNCTYAPIVDLFSFAELLYILMQGCGAGFSVESDYVGQLPLVQRQKKQQAVNYTIPDTTEGWCDALYLGLQTWFAGGDVNYDYSHIRSTGSLLKTKGGHASGPGPLLDLLAFARSTVLGAQGRHLTDLEVHDICCMEGKIVQVGGVRRASCISLSDLDSILMREAKHGNWWEKNGQRSMANNSAVYDEPPPVEVFLTEWLALVKSRSGERGIFNRHGVLKNCPTRRTRCRFGVNPCGEITLRPWGCCNLTISIVRGHETREELAEKVRAATYFGVLQSCATDFQYVRKEWAENCKEERLLGVDIMGHLDHPMLRPGASGREELVTYLKGVVEETAKELSSRFGINYSAANTCLKPGGDSGALFATTSLSPYFSPYQIRMTRESVRSPMSQFLKEAGVPWEPASEDEQGLVAFAWPRKNPEGCITRNDMTALEQLENWLFWQTHWAEHSCSVTIYVKEEEWPEVGAWVWKNLDKITLLSFLPWDNGTYRTAPNQALTKEEYEKMLQDFPHLDWSKLIRYERNGEGLGSRVAVACSGDRCER